MEVDPTLCACVDERTHPIIGCVRGLIVMDAWKDETLDEDAAMDILDEILAAQNESVILGRKLNIPKYIVDEIHSRYSSSRDRLYHVIVEFLKQVEPRPTWRVILDAFKSPSINLPRLAAEIERKHSPAQSAMQGSCTFPGTFFIGCFTGVHLVHVFVREFIG